MAVYRPLSQIDKEMLVANGCSAADWSAVSVSDGFDPMACRGARFSGTVRIGSTTGSAQFPGGVERACGIVNALVHNCTIGDNVLIADVRGSVANCDIENGVVVANIDQLAAVSHTRFGNGLQIPVLNEVGGREIPIYDSLSAPLAYVLAFYRYRTAVIEKLFSMIEAYADSVASDRACIGAGSRIVNCGSIIDTRIGPAAVLDGCRRLENASINSTAADPIHIGTDVIARDIIVCSGTHITDGAQLVGCFVGQGCELGRQYSAEHSVFFANCTGFHGEACAIFAGPFTVTHHKSTLLIAGYFSFLNAGSGSNQSNHMYKLGPLHQGVVERGSKTTSDSYLLWPARVGPFTMVMGRHVRNADTADLPFSYLIESEDESVLIPGVNLRSVGTIRDAMKWPRRDRRKDPDRLDAINFNLLSPFTISKMLRGREILKSLVAMSGETSDSYYYHSVKIRNSSLRHGLDFYHTGIVKFLGNSLITRLGDREYASDAEIRSRLTPDSATGLGRWLDLAGLIAPESGIKELLDDIESDRVITLASIQERFMQIHKNYYSYEWTWALSAIESWIGKPLAAFTAADVVAFVQAWKDAVVGLDRLLLDDARKEFSLTARTGFGLDGDESMAIRDFEQVRGTFESNDFVREIERHIEAKSALGDATIAKMERCIAVSRV